MAPAQHERRRGSSMKVSSVFAALALCSTSLSAQAPPHERHVLIVTPSEGDPRLTATREAIAFWNDTLSTFQVPFRFVEDGVLVAPSSTRSFEGYTRGIWLLAGRPTPPDMTPRPPAELEAIGAEIVVFFSSQRIFSFSWPRAAHQKFFIGFQPAIVPPLTFPNVARNVIAHELGHVLGLEHNGRTKTLMCGPCDHSVYRSAEVRFFPLTAKDRARLRSLE